MLYRSFGFAMTACLSSALLIGCAGGGSSITQSAAAIPSAVQGGNAPGGASIGRRVHSGVRTMTGCTSSGALSFVGGGEGNLAHGSDSFVGDGDENEACDALSAIVDGYGDLVSGSGSDGFIGGGEENSVTGDDLDSAIVAGDANAVSNTESAIVGGQQNSLSAAYGFIGGGYLNTVSAEYGVIAGGTNNTVSGEGAYIAAGGYNTASGEGALVDGGFKSTAGGAFATIPGGYANSAAGVYSFAAGARASAANEGAFVWSDGSDGDTMLTSSRAYQFLARASGGFTLYTNAASTVGAQLAAGSGTWASLSDRNAKTNIAPLDEAAVLDKVAALPIERWSYKSEHGVRHVGPMAQDFYAAFRVGEDDKHITSIDEDGVALAAIKALHAENAQLRARLATATASQSARIAAMQVQLQHLSAQMAALHER